MTGDIFRYGDEAVVWLSGRDPVLGRAMARIGPIARPVMPDLFAALVRAVVEQQVSMKAADTVWKRLEARFGPPRAAVYGYDTGS